jgi:hypothetical protein
MGCSPLHFTFRNLQDEQARGTRPTDGGPRLFASRGMATLALGARPPVLLALLLSAETESAEGDSSGRGVGKLFTISTP